MEKGSQTALMSPHPDKKRSFRFISTALLLCLASYTTWQLWTPVPAPALSVLEQADFSHLAGHCYPPAITATAYASRLSSVASVLTSLNASAYIIEPSPNALYYANVSLSSWGLSERPLLVVITSEAKVSIVTPKFEVTRAKLLPVPFEGVQYFEWAEADSPYEAVLKALPAGVAQGGKVYVDEMARLFIATGLQAVAPEMKVEIAPLAVKALREKKTAEELAIMHCVNELTLMAIREVRKHLHFGMHESEGRALVSKALGQAGLGDIDNIFLVGENAALPHGHGTDRQITKHDFILIDCGGSLHGYKSDVTRTFALPGSKIPTAHLEIWYSVQTSQKLALAAANPGSPALGVDAAARGYLNTAGLATYFTHRLGHGIGLEVHESPYLLSSSRLPLEVGNTFSDEPGVYIEGKVGVRLEDCFVVTAEGGEPLTKGAGGFAKNPWDI
ncbi:Creatinase/aminopeptidase [Calocera cornea HHB12733]|uniref:Creatinase/aminopeptidase n=1 Tax=Calocera cornea HHB12733 TaxID=1353952 RepID=A0A165DUC4_9BASI|nr:Creatinase/aminopeptidase [Calocera cornea HHB12733]